MKSSARTQKSLERGPLSWILSALVLITLYFQTNLYDPFNSPKSWILLLTASWLLGYIFAFRKILFTDDNLKISFALVVLFIFATTLVTLFTDSKFVAVFGEALRRNGYLSYISLSIIFIASIIFIRTFNVSRFYVTTIWISLVVTIYSSIQSTGNDFVAWNNPYNQIIGTLGNPNFAAAVMAIIGVLVFCVVLIDDFKLHYRLASIFISLVLLYLIFQSDARQGLLVYFIGVSIFFTIFLFGKRKKIAIFLTIALAFLFAFGVLGMLQIGPLERYLYKPSVSVRGYYWRAGLEMFLNNPILGIGMDRYGAYFKEYREAGYSLTYGYNITSSNAHNTFIQFFATGGAVLGLSYLLLNAFILKCAITGLRKHSGNNQLRLAGVFAAWVAFHAQSFISIDNIGVSIWGWILAGSIIGISVSSNSNLLDDRKKYIGSPIKIDLNRLIISSIFTTIAIAIVSVSYRGEADSYNARVILSTQDQSSRDTFLNLQKKVIEASIIDPTYRVGAASSLVQSGFNSEGLTALRDIHANDRRNLDAIKILALTYESLNDTAEANYYRLQLAKYDEWNAENYLELGRNYKKLGDFTNSKAMLMKILSFAPNDPIAAQAKLDLG